MCCWNKMSKQSALLCFLRAVLDCEFFVSYKSSGFNRHSTCNQMTATIFLKGFCLKSQSDIKAINAKMFIQLLYGSACDYWLAYDLWRHRINICDPSTESKSNLDNRAVSRPNEWYEFRREAAQVDTIYDSC